MLMLLFASTLRWLPTAGMVDVRAVYSGLRAVLDVMIHMALPVTYITLLQFPSYYRIVRSSVLQTMSEEYVQLFRATGMAEATIFRRYVLKMQFYPR